MSILEASPHPDCTDFQKAILDYYDAHGRSFPWRTTNDPYSILVSEFMLQQTQTERVIEKYNRWLEVFPTVQDLAEASLVQVLEQWVGLGYNRRAYNKPNAFIETNIRAVFIFFFFKDRTDISDKELFPHIEASLYKENPRLWYYALMDYGAELKKKTVNPNRKSRHYTKQSKFEGSVRQARGAVIRTLTAHNNQGYAELYGNTQTEKLLFDKALEGLIREGFVAEQDGCYSISR